ncbi:MAG: alpha/beta hydrolase [Mycobacteriaceae bacterium]
MLSKTVTFASLDGLLITADEYLADNALGSLLLCHRSHFNRGEYRETAKKFQSLGYSCLAIDQRSGMKVLGTTNETYLLAKQQGRATGYVAAKPDIEAAIEYCYLKNSSQPIVIVGSSYSASLALLIGSENGGKLSGIIAFSPGEYLKGITLSETLHTLTVPTIVLPEKKDYLITQQLLKNADKSVVSLFHPQTEGAHGSRSLWSKTTGNDEYWSVVLEFLHKVWPIKPQG